MNNPTIKELQDEEQFELIAQLNHKQIKEFVIQQLQSSGKLVRIYMVYQLVMVLIGMFFLAWSIVSAFQNYFEPLYYTIAAMIFCFSALIIIHELLHGAALKLLGARNINFGAYFKKFIFYAEADQFVMNKKQFELVALAPFVTIKLITLIGIFLSIQQPILFLFIIVMSAHSLFCAGDIGLLSIFYRYGESEIYTYDIKAEKTSYYFRRRSRTSPQT